MSNLLLIQSALNSIACVLLLAHTLDKYDCRDLRGKAAGILVLYTLGVVLNLLLGFFVP